MTSAHSDAALAERTHQMLPEDILPSTEVMRVGENTHLVREHSPSAA